ncbi:hypothetical protein KVT40_003872 [Elsinoe batatas]|uniref:Uncharacterized protein n=1 Tax=Elsinoe batatas TaxID=2601811 RepID=A0A8K0L3W6_9PEZI|nr:hypothetical protein KVT40_003872 [Elsinoe batatas]
MKFISLATLSLATLALATPAAQDEGLAPAPTPAPGLPGASSGDSDKADRIKSLIDQFRSRRPGLPVPTGLSGFPGLGDLGSGLTELAPADYEVAAEDDSEDADELDFEGVARQTGRPGRPTRRPRPGRPTRRPRPTGSFPRPPRPTGAAPEEPEAPDAGDSPIDGASEEEPVLGAARPTGRPSRPRPGRPTRRPRPTGGFPGFPRPTGIFPRPGRPTGTPDAGEEPSDDLTKRTFDFDEGEEVVEGAARPTGRPSRPRPGRPTRRPRPTGGFPGFPRPTGGFPRPGCPTPTGAADGEEPIGGVALPTGRPGRPSRPRPGRPGRPVGPTGVVPGLPRPTGDYE